MSYKTLNELFEAHTDIKVDKKLVLKVFEFVENFMNKNESHISFFSGNLIGVYPIRFLSRDADNWFEDILQLLDPVTATDDLHEMDGVNPKFNVTSNLFNVSCMWLAHKFYVSNLPKKEKELGVTYAWVMFFCSRICSLQTRRFPYKADPAIAMAVYESLTKKTNLRLHGSWRELLIAQAEVTIESSFVHKKDLEKLETESSLKMLADLSNRLNKMINLMTEHYHDFKEQKDAISSSSALILTEEGQSIKEYTNSITQVKRDLASVIVDPLDFIKDELVEATLNVANTANERFLREALEYVSDNYRADKRLPDIAETLVVYMVANAKSKKQDIADVPAVIYSLLNVMRSSRTNNKDILVIRELSSEVIKDAISTKRKIVLTATQIAMVIYIAIRALTLGRYI